MDGAERAGASARPAGARGRRPGARGAHRGRPVGSPRRRRRLQLLPEQEPRRAGRRRRDLHRRRRAIAERARRLRNLGQRAQGRAHRSWLQRAPGRPPGGAAGGQAEAASRAATASGVAWPAAIASCSRPAAGPLEEAPERECVYHLFPVRLAERDQVAPATRAARNRDRDPLLAGTSTASRRCRRLLTAAAASSGRSRWSEQELSLPMFPELTDGELEPWSRRSSRPLEEERRPLREAALDRSAWSASATGARTCCACSPNRRTSR